MMALYYDYLSNWFLDILWNISDYDERLLLREKIDKLIKWHFMWIFVDIWLKNDNLFWREFIYQTTKDSLMKNFDIE